MFTARPGPKGHAGDSVTGSRSRQPADRIWLGQEMEQNEVFRCGVRYLKLTVARFGQVVSNGVESTVESPAGQSTTRDAAGPRKDQALALTGTVGEDSQGQGRGRCSWGGARPGRQGGGVAREPRLFKESASRDWNSDTRLHPDREPWLRQASPTRGGDEGVMGEDPGRKLLRFHKT